jgi:hypothetical protein
MKIHYWVTSVLIVGVFAFFSDGFAQSKLTPLQQRLVSGFVSSELSKPPAALQPAAREAVTELNFLSLGSGALSYYPVDADACKETIGSNVKVNQNCVNISDPDLQGRSQAQNETAIAQDPNHADHLVAAYNDYRRGDGTCGVSYSLDGGQHWNDSTTPNGFTRGTSFGGVAREYWQAAGDPSVAWDTKGNAYLNCQTFLRGSSVTNNPDQSSAVYVFRSTQNNGASWNFPGRPVVEDFDQTGATLEDKPYMAVDNHVGSPFQDRIYVTWTEFAADGTAYIWESHSNDYGEHFTSRVLVSATGTFCAQTFGLPTPHGNCNENQFSQPFTGLDGTLYVVYSNFNNTVSGSDNRNQVLLAKSTDGGMTFNSPVKVADYYDLPDCATYQAGQDAGRACVPEKGPTANSVFRAVNYASGAVNPKTGAVAVTFASYINLNSQEPACVPAGFSAFGNNIYTGVKTTPGCADQILLSVSTDAGATFTGGTTNPRMLPVVSVQKKVADAFWQWAAYTRSGVLAVSYYDRSYGNDNATGSLDVSASWSSDGRHFYAKRATSSSMPPPTQFSGVFFGDYAGLSAVDGLHPIWMDTRNNELFLCPGTGVPGVPPSVCTAAAPNAPLANDQDIFTTTIQMED